MCEKLGIAVEFNGKYWHNNKIIKNKRISANFYHYYKFEQTYKKLGLVLLFVREQNWDDNKENVLAAIKNFCFKHTEIPEILQARY